MYLPLAVRRHKDMKDVLMVPNADGPDIHYYMIRGGKDKTNITIWESGNIAGEYIKTYGHYHVGNFEEIYWIVGGEGIVLLQQREVDQDNNPIDDEIETFVAIKVKAGDNIRIPSEMGHLVVNIGNTWLVTIDNSPIRRSDITDFPSHADYESVKKMHGFAYYIVDAREKPKLIRNNNYKIIPEPQWLTPTEWQNSLKNNSKSKLDHI